MPNPNDLEYRNYHDHLPQAPEKKSSSMWLWIILIVLIIIAAGLAYMLFFKNKNDGKPNTNVETQLPGTRAGDTP